jgi:hypothetical protein
VILNSVVIPTFARPEFLALCLEKIDHAVNAPDDIRIFLDTASIERLSEVEWVRDTFLPRAEIFHAKPHIFAPSGCWNILNSIKQGYETGAENIFLIEEDILIKPNYFTWHLSQTNCLASCGRKDPHHFPRYGPLYTNPGSCLRRELVEQLIPHINSDYFTRLREYLDEKLPPKWDEQSMLDDGLIRRVIRQMGGQAVYPEKPVCTHIGWRFYNKLDLYMNFETTMEGKIRRLQELMQSIKPGDRYASDFEFY